MALTVSTHKSEKGIYSEKRIYIFTKFKRIEKAVFKFLEQDKQPDFVEKTEGEFLNILDEQENEMIKTGDEFYALVSYAKDRTKDIRIYFEHIMPISKENE